jgi:hypothetical protein
MKRIIILLLFTKAFFCTAQNLVPNPSFEEYSECPYQNGQLPFAVPWFTDLYHWGPFGVNGSSSEYFNMCDSITGGTFPIYSSQKPRTGNGEVACAFYTSPLATQEYREYIEVILNQPLALNKSYCISYYVSLFGYSAYSIDALCACLTTDSLLNQDQNIMLLPCPNMVCNRVGNIIKDTLNWIKISMSYTAQGGEKFLTIGNFKTTAQTNSEFIALTYGWSTYYFIDDVAVYECNTPAYTANAGGNKCIKAGDSITLGSPTRAEYLYWWYDMQGNLLDTTATITVKPTQTTTYYLVQKDFKFDETRDTVTVSVGSCDTLSSVFQIYPNPTNGLVNVRFNTIVPIGATMQLYDMLVQKVAEFPLTSATNIATVNLGNLATAVYHATVVVPDGFRKSVKLVVIRND